MPDRPGVSVIVPFGGTAEDAQEMRDNIARLHLRPGDEVIIADNTSAGVVNDAVPGIDAVLVAVTDHASAYSARNAAAAAARNDWLLFTDADCRPDPDLLDAFFRPPPGEDCGAVVGPMLAFVRRSTFVSRYQQSRNANEQADHFEHSSPPFGATGNLLVRSDAFRAIGGFHEGIRSGGDADLCWRLQGRGWTVEYRDDAAVHHRQRETLRAMLRQHLRYGAGGQWLRVRHPDVPLPASASKRIARALAGAARQLGRGRLRDAGYRVLDAVIVAIERLGAFTGNRTPAPAAPADGRPGRRIALMVDLFPEMSETFVTAEAHALIALGARVRVEAIGRAHRPHSAAAAGIDSRFLEDDGRWEHVRDLIWLVRRHPFAAVRDVLWQRRWRREEWPVPLRSLAPLARRILASGDEHLHAHFAAGAALSAMRLSRMLGIPYSVTAHGYDIFQSPRNLAEKLEGAAFATSGSDYTVGEIRRRCGQAGDRTYKIVMGVDPLAWRRTSTHGAEPLVLAIGRLVEKKGFDVLLRAAALLEPEEARVVIVGDGPQRRELEALHGSLGLGDRVELAGACPPAVIRDFLERSAVMAVPCVIAADGDRDSMPVVAKEALAMEVPVVASDVCGLPEVVHPAWGRLVPPGDHEALAAALNEILAISSEERAAMGRRGRNFITTSFSVHTETSRLLSLIDDAVAGREPQPPPAPALEIGALAGETS